MIILIFFNYRVYLCTSMIRTMYLWLNHCLIGIFVASIAGFTFGFVGAFVIGSSVWWIARLDPRRFVIWYNSSLVLVYLRGGTLDGVDIIWYVIIYLICSFIHSGGNFGGYINYFLLVFFVRERIFHLCFTLYPLFNEFICLSRVRINHEKKQTGRYEQSVTSLWCCWWTTMSMFQLPNY